MAVGAHRSAPFGFLLQQAGVDLQAANLLVEMTVPADAGVTELEDLLAPEPLLRVPLAHQ